MILKYCAAIIIRGKKVLLLRRSLDDDSYPGDWCPVNGSIEEGELPEETVIREVKEEAGLEFTITSQLDNIFGEYVFLGTAKGKIKLEEEEVCEFGWFTYKEAKKLKLAYDYSSVIEHLHKLNLIG